jgi:hypothetical protein
MGKNRRSQAGAVRLVPALKAFLLCLLLGGSGVGYVLQKNKLHELGREIARKELQLERLRAENRIRANQLANLLLPQRLAQRVRDQNLGLVPPAPGQIVWLNEDSPMSPTNVPNLAMTSEAARP